MTLRREYWAALLLCLAGAVLLLLAASQDWATRAPAGGGFAGAFVDSLESGLAPGVARVLGLAALAGVVAVGATRRRWRQVVGAVVLVVGVYAAALAHKETTAARGTATGWPWVAVAGGALVACGGLLVVVRGSRWAAMPSRYDGPQRAEPTADAPADAAREQSALWDALSRGDDPTES